MARRKFFGNLGIGMDSILPGTVGGGATLGTALLLKAFVPQFVMKKDVAGVEAVETKDGKPVESFWFKNASLVGMGVGILGSIVVGYYKGWGSAAAGSIAAIAAGATAQFADGVAPTRDPVTGKVVTLSAYPYMYRGGSHIAYGLMTARKNPYGNLMSRPAAPSLPENVTALGTRFMSNVNTRAFGG